MTTQLTLLNTLDPEMLQTFLAAVLRIEDQADGLREELRLLKEEYQGFLPIRATLTAIKVVRAQRKLAAHPTEPLPRPQQGRLEGEVERFLDRLEAEREAAVQEAQALAQGVAAATRPR